MNNTTPTVPVASVDYAHRRGLITGLVVGVIGGGLLGGIVGALVEEGRYRPETGSARDAARVSAIPERPFESIPPKAAPASGQR